MNCRQLSVFKKQKKYTKTKLSSMLLNKIDDETKVDIFE